jgi:hypothetical protein
MTARLDDILAKCDAFDEKQPRDEEGKWVEHSPRFSKKKGAFEQKRKYEAEGREAKVFRHTGTYTIPGRGHEGTFEEYSVRHRPKQGS